MFIVVKPYALAKVDTSEGVRLLGYLEGSVLPESTQQESIDHLLSVGIIEELSSPELDASAVPDDGTAAPVVGDQAPPVPDQLTSTPAE